MLAFSAKMDEQVSQLCKQEADSPNLFLALQLYNKLEPQLTSISIQLSPNFHKLFEEIITDFDKRLRLSDAATRIICGLLPDIPGFSCANNADLPPLLMGGEVLDKLSICLESTSAASPAVIRLIGEKNCGKAFLLHKLSEKHKIPLTIMDAEDIPEEGTGQEQYMNAAFLSLMVAPSIVCLRHYEDTPRLKRVAAALQKAAPFLCISMSAEAALPSFSPDILQLTYRLPAPSRSESRFIWETALRDCELEVDFDLRPIANQYRLPVGDVMAIAQSLARRKDIGLQFDESALRESIEEKVHQGISGGLARLIRPRFGWDDIILPDDLKNRLREICSRMKNSDLVMEKWGFSEKYPYGSGMSILFYGAPGTGKTMAAHVIAKELHTPLFYVDFSNLIDKYIGETEKHILEIFRQAKQIGAILFFDEADAIFARRSEVSDATDRYANAQTACLLQCIEEYEGIVILATNLLSNFDEAFKRRMRYFLHFFHPDQTARRDIWKSVFPKQAALADELDFDKLAIPELPAGTIKNIALTAAFLAVDDGAIGIRHLNQALLIERMKDGHSEMDDSFEV